MIKEAYEAGINEAIEKVAGKNAEIASTFLNPLNMGLTIPAGILGYVSDKPSAKTKKERDEAEFSNLLPGVGPYRLGARLKHNRESF